MFENIVISKIISDKGFRPNLYIHSNIQWTKCDQHQSKHSKGVTTIHTHDMTLHLALLSAVLHLRHHHSTNNTIQTHIVVTVSEWSETAATTFTEWFCVKVRVILGITFTITVGNSRGIPVHESRMFKSWYNVAHYCIVVLRCIHVKYIGYI